MNRRAWPAKRPELRPSRTLEERDFVRRYGTKATIVRYSGRDDMVGLRVLGKSSGFQIEAGEKPGERYFRVLTVEGLNVVTTPRKLALRFADSLHHLVTGTRSWVR